MQSTCVHNFTFLDLAVPRPQISFLLGQKFKVDHLTLTTPLLRVICYSYAGTLHSLHVTALASAVSEIWLVPIKI